MHTCGSEGEWSGVKVSKKNGCEGREERKWKWKGEKERKGKEISKEKLC